MRVVITGVNGFIGRNLRVRLGEVGHADVRGIGRTTTSAELNEALSGAEFVFHLAGINRPSDPAEFQTGNGGFTEVLCAAHAAAGCRAPIAFTSSTQAALDNPYGHSKRAAEEVLLRHGRQHRMPVYVLRLTNVFGKWSRPYYNSAVATFCHQVAHGQSVSVNDPASRLRLIHVDDVVTALMALLVDPPPIGGFVDTGPIHETTVGELADTLRGFAHSRETLTTARVGTGLTRALYATYVSFLPPESFSYDVPQHGDPRGVFVEMLKTPDCGQFSYFTAKPGITRGGHYHHSKTEKFLVIQGTARFGFRQIETGEVHELTTKGGQARIVETVPGWTHDITNIGEDELVVMLWANEVFDQDRPDTVAMKVKP